MNKLDEIDAIIAKTADPIATDNLYRERDKIAAKLDPFADFKSELAQNITKTIRALKRDGTVKMGLRNLLAVTPTPRNSRGPIGTNAQWVYGQMFEEIANSLPVARKFLL